MANKQKAKGRLRIWRVVKRSLLFGGLLGAGAGAFTLYANLATQSAGEGKVFSSVDEVPAGRVGLVFGCSAKVGKYTNRYFRYRIEAAAELWQAGKVKGFIVSGDNSRDSYNEPDDMKAALVEKGVPAEKVVCDYAGLRTFDSVVRAKEIFGAEQVVFVSQQFQNERAQYMAQRCELDAVSYNAEDVEGKSGQKTKIREVLARPKMVLDFALLGTEPKYLGKKEELPF